MNVEKLAQETIECFGSDVLKDVAYYSDYLPQVFEYIEKDIIEEVLAVGISTIQPTPGTTAEQYARLFITQGLIKLALNGADNYGNFTIALGILLKREGGKELAMALRQALRNNDAELLK